VVAITDNRFARTNIRVVLRQLRASDNVSPSLLAWTAAHDHHHQTSIEPQDFPDPHEQEP